MTLKSFNRRLFLKKSGLSALAYATSSIMYGASKFEKVKSRTVSPSDGTYLGGFEAPKLDKVRVAVIGLGSRGFSHVQKMARIDGVQIVALSDLYEDLVQRSLTKINELSPNKHHEIATYYGDERLWKKMIQDTKPDAVFVVTDWNTHADMGVFSLKEGAHTFIEVPIATTLEEMWDLVNTAEKVKRHCMMLENVNYGREELLYLNMCRKGLIGDLLHGEASYIHELRGQMNQEERGTGSWRTLHYAERNGNLYPTHGLGPVAQYMNLCRGEDQFHSLVSMSSPALGRKEFAEKHYPKNHKWNKLSFVAGDINSSIVKTHLGRTILVQWDETSPRPYSRHNLIQGTKGTLAGFPNRIALEGGIKGATGDHHGWASGESLEILYEKYEHPLYKRLGAISNKMGGHGGMDSLMLLRVFECLQKGLPMDQNVYEGCAWSAVGPLSEDSVATGGTPQSFPDFTRGKWKSTEPLEVVA